MYTSCFHPIQKKKPHGSLKHFLKVEWWKWICLTPFWGAYYGSCKDKFGVQWMFNFQYSNPEQGHQ
jgi:hypothetical protein